MKATAVLGALMAFLVFTGFDCINDSFAVAVAVDPVTVGFRINPGSTSLNDTKFVYLKDYVDPDYQEDLIGGAIWDVGVRVNRAAANRFATGTITVDGIELVRFDGSQKWDDFIAEKTVAKNPALLSANSAGINHLIALLSKPLTDDPVVFVSNGSVTTAVVAGDSVYVTLYAQALSSVKM